jgi:N-acetylmuramoyl-L-alanine amidase
VQRLPPPPAPEWPQDSPFINGASLLPDTLHALAPGEAVEVAVQATPGARVQAQLPGQSSWQNLHETSPGRYRAGLRFEHAQDVEPAAIKLRLGDQLLALTPGLVGQWRADAERLLVTGAEGADLLHGLHEVRLGGPFLAELPAGVLLATTGQRDKHLRVQLSADTEAWVAASAVAPAAPGTAVPRVSFSNLSAASSAEGDVLTVPLSAAVPYAVQPHSDNSGHASLLVDIYGAHHATTWVSHRAGLRVIREVSAEQAGPGRVRLRISLLQARLWGWRVERSASALRITLRAAPRLAPGSLQGITVALEAGHGGASNLGAVGATGVPEKDINRWTADALQAELQAAGAQVVQVREGDDNPSQRERAARALASQAHLFVSVHANSADTTGGVLRVQGTSMFYKHSHSRDLAAAIQRQLLAQTGLADFGLVGNFNYTPMRLCTWMPAVLVEQAFLSHPGDEAQLLNPAFRQVLAQAVCLGVQDFLSAA